MVVIIIDKTVKEFHCSATDGHGAQCASGAGAREGKRGVPRRRLRGGAAALRCEHRARL